MKKRSKICLECGNKFTPRRLFKIALTYSTRCNLKKWRKLNPEHNRMININWRRKNGVL